MTIIAIYTLILIILIISLMKYFETNTKTDWHNFLYCSISSFISVISFVIYAYFIKEKFQVEFKVIGISSLVVISICFIILFVGINYNKKNKESYQVSIKKSSIIEILTKIIIIPVLITSSIFIEHIPNHINYEENKKFQSELQKNILTHLNERYGDGNFKIIKMEKLETNNYDKDTVYNDKFSYESIPEPSYDYKATISTKYMKEDFELLINSSYREYKKDNFIETYLIENKKMNKNESLREYLKEQVSSPLKSYDAYIDVKYLNFYNSFYNEKYGQIPTTEQLLKSLSFETGEITIIRKFTKDQEDDFKEYMMELTKIYLKNYVKDYSPQGNVIFRFNFPYDNPFATGKHYTDGGYVRISSSIVWIYNKAKPIEAKLDKKLLFEMTSSKLKCPTAYIKVYEDNMYEYIDNSDDFASLGIYNYDISKILDNIESLSDDKAASYTLTIKDKKYSIYENKEVEEFLESIDVNLHRCIR